MKTLLIIILVILFKEGFTQDTTSVQVVTNEKQKAISVTGFVEAYYVYDFNKPSDNNRPAFVFSHNRHNEFNINLAYLKATYAVENVRANLSIAAGTYMNANYAAEPGVLKNIFEANAGYKLIPGKNLWLDVGILPSHIGWESAISKDCPTLTRSIAADNTPYFESGARISYTSQNGKWYVSGLALNGWQRITRLNGNSLISWGAQLTYKPNDKVQLNYSNFFGTDKPDSARKWRYFHDVFGIIQVSKKVNLTAGFDYGQEQVSPHSSSKYSWYSPAVILQLRPLEKWAGAIRGEYYRDKNGVIISTGTANGFDTMGYSVNIDYLPEKNISIRIEGKIYSSKDAIFIKNSIPENNNESVSFSMAVAF